MRELTVQEIPCVSGAAVFPALNDPMIGAFCGAWFGAMIATEIVAAPFMMLGQYAGGSTRNYIETTGIIVSIPFALAGGIAGMPVGLMLGGAVYLSDRI